MISVEIETPEVAEVCAVAAVEMSFYILLVEIPNHPGHGYPKRCYYLATRLA